MLWLTRSVTGSKVINCPLNTALQVLHDPPSLIDLNPIVISKTVDPSNPTLYTITDRLSLFEIPTTTTYTASFTPREDGIDSDVKAGAGTTLQTKWRAKTVEGGTEVSEDVTLRGLFFLVPFIVGTLQSSHQTLLQNLTAKLEAEKSNDKPSAPSQEVASPNK